MFENKITACQFGFRKYHRTTDSLFILKTIINKYVNQNKQKIFGCFIDLKKAFDSIWRLGLLYKILKNQDVSEKMYNIIKNIYKHHEASVKVKENISEPVSIDRGLKQGDSLSSNLFNIYINDIPQIFDDSCKPVTLENMSLGCLMFADDLLILSETAEGLQKSLNELQNYCNN